MARLSIPGYVTSMPMVGTNAQVLDHVAEVERISEGGVVTGSVERLLEVGTK